ncbi:hypothetical protein VCR3J2_310262 [Vibrio coralliirubri]|uniref:site-specific integrase n=1 Tax=Vibrio coralliirubri TaxID=1516159 RepID=UPI000632FBC9|nr:site-specific integrase [Vibrio coralliirubri]CDT86953.1 hypothetical protein VCR3J2_310262 [Vibrio coralliirubri]
MGHAATQYLDTEVYEYYSAMYEFVAHLNGDCEPFPNQIETYHGQTVRLRNSHGRLLSSVRLINVGEDNNAYPLEDSYSGDIYLDYIAAQCWIDTAIEHSPASIGHLSTGLASLREVSLSKKAFDKESNFAREVGASLASIIIKNKTNQCVFLAIRQFVKYAISNEFWGFTDDVDLVVSEVAVKALGQKHRVSMLDHEYGAFSRTEIAQITTAINDVTFDLEHGLLVGLAKQYGLRPIQLALLREEDIYYDKKKLAWYIMIPRVKGRVAQLRRTKGNFINRELPSDLALKAVKLIEKHTHIVMTHNGVTIPRPLFKARKIDSLYLKDKRLLPYAWHRNAGSLYQFFSKTLPAKLGIESMHCKDEDGKPMLLKTHAYRFRYTLGTRMVLEGKTPEEVALALDHSSTASVRHYFRYNQDLIDFIDDTFEGSTSLKNSALRWQGYFIDEDDNIEGSLIKTSDVLSLGKCLKKTLCEYHPTVSCYGCSKFRPFKDIDHSKQLQVIKKEVEFVRSNSTGAVLHQLSEAYEGAIQIVEAQKALKGTSND